MLKIDLHIHTRNSGDSIIDLNKLDKIIEAKSIDGVAITDHNKYTKPPKSRYIIIPGIELNTNYGEIIGLFINEKINSKNFLEAVDEIKSQGGLIILPHPYDIFRLNAMKPKPRLYSLLAKILDGIEVINSRCLISQFNTKARELAIKLEKAMTAGSDAHTPYEVGKAYTQLKGSTSEDVYRAIKRKMTYPAGGKSNPIYRLISTVVKFSSIL